MAVCKFFSARQNFLAAALLTATCAFAQTDPGVRHGAPGAGGTFRVLDNTNPAADRADHDFFLQTLGRFQEVDSVSGTITPGNGLGPAFNHNSCAGCHAQPAIGGTSPAVNPQVVNKDGSSFAHLAGASNPANTSGFLSVNGPVREVRFIKNPDGSLDGGVHDIFTIAGRIDAPGCNLQQPDFVTAIATHNASFRIPTPTFGLGLVQDVSDEFLKTSMDNTASQRAARGIAGKFNTNGNDGTITRFGWKAQNKSLLIFAGEAYNVEQGVTNEVFQNDRFPGDTTDATIANCTFNTSPEDNINVLNGQANTIVGGVSRPNPNVNTPIGTASEMSADTVNFAEFMRMLAPPTPTTSSASELDGHTFFTQVGCALCHTETLVTVQKNGHGINGGANSLFPALAGFTFHPFSDFAVHHMGSGLSDGVNQGGAGPDEFRSAPLWGVGQRIFFLHDGRTSDLLQAIQAHASPGSEANQVIAAFNALDVDDKQHILDFLRSL